MMKGSRGYVIQVDAGGGARVLVPRHDSGQGCSSPEDRCHCRERGDGLVLKAENRAGAGVGDYVSVVFKPGAVLKSLLVLMGLPSLGILAGLFAGTAVRGQPGILPEHAFLTGAACFVLSVIMAALLYRGIGSQLQPFVDRVMTASRGQSLVSGVDPVCGRAVDPLGPAAKIDYEGRTYRFCGADCLGAFVKDPRRYARPHGCARCGAD
jgi:YHS domain-containing protein